MAESSVSCSSSAGVFSSCCLYFVRRGDLGLERIKAMSERVRKKGGQVAQEITCTVIGEEGREDSKELNPSITHIVVARTLSTQGFARFLRDNSLTEASISGGRAKVVCDDWMTKSSQMNKRQNDTAYLYQFSESTPSGIPSYVSRSAAAAAAAAGGNRIDAELVSRRERVVGIFAHPCVLFLKPPRRFEAYLKANGYGKHNADLQAFCLAPEEALYLVLLGEMGSFPFDVRLRGNLDASFMSCREAYEAFCRSQLRFAFSFRSYVYLRLKGWVVKSGMKFGANYLLYASTPEKVHAQYAVQLHPHQPDDEGKGGPAPDMSDDDVAAERSSKRRRLNDGGGDTMAVGSAEEQQREGDAQPQPQPTTWREVVCGSRLAVSVAKDVVVVREVPPIPIPPAALPHPPSPDLTFLLGLLGIETKTETADGGGAAVGGMQDGEGVSAAANWLGCRGLILRRWQPHIT
ncbi:unnamed protein product [Vitrella brassicaformis CCMP3155]|uniref:tRNA-intron lyase n=2 Tax=Vitrella brassicaformis TaxID=1169539 RepID=A0A0G4GUI9_VITBC|nr:unnamed protein product [Vitrella brassicaformis CCMP3155]|eukprot:CEM34478.1 unnamed protein product [Vitrella brassicaformis CCMP3155]